MYSARIIVFGPPAPKGSKDLVHLKSGKTVMIESSKYAMPAMRAVAAHAFEVAPQSPLEGAVGVTIFFLMPRPKSTSKKITHHIKRPDVDKLARTVLDGLQYGGVFRDDSQVAKLSAIKSYSDVAQTIIEVEELQ